MESAAGRYTCPLWVDAVEKGENELTEIFLFAPVEIVIS